MFGCGGKSSLISKNVAEIRISIHLAREITWQHDTCEPRRQHEWLQFATTIKESGRVAPFPSVRLPHNSTRWAIRGWHLHNPGIHHYMRSEGSSNSATIEATKFARTPKFPYVLVHNQYLLIKNQPMRSLIDTGGGNYLWALNLTSDYSHPSNLVFPTFP
jgi:hypothetical protein